MSFKIKQIKSCLRMRRLVPNLPKRVLEQTACSCIYLFILLKKNQSNNLSIHYVTRILCTSQIFLRRANFPRCVMRAFTVFLTKNLFQVRPLLPNVHQLHYQVSQVEQQRESPLLQGVNIQLDANLTLAQLNEHFQSGSLKGTSYINYLG